MIRLWTVPHSGTHFMESLLRDWNQRFGHRHIAVNTFLFQEIRSEGKVLVTLRDPLLCRISTINRHGHDPYTKDPVWLWRQVMEVAHLPNVHLIQIDQPRLNEDVRLSRFLELEQTHDWDVVQSHRDSSGLKQQYESGTVPDCLKHDMRLLNEMGARQFFQDQQYHLPWMRNW